MTLLASPLLAFGGSLVRHLEMGFQPLHKPTPSRTASYSGHNDNHSMNAPTTSLLLPAPITDAEDVI